MANACPNKSAPQWQALVSELGNSVIRGMKAFMANENTIPDVNSELVQGMKESNLKFGEPVEVVLDEEGRETDAYKGPGGKLYNRISKFVANFAARQQDRSKSMAERKADREWKDTPKEEKRVTEYGEQSWEEYKDEVQYNIDKAIAKGNLMHLAMELKMKPHRAEEIQAKMDAIEAEWTDATGNVPFSWKWILDEGKDGGKGVIEQVFDNLGINFFHDLDTFDDFLRDEVMTEVSVASDIMEIAGTVDMLVRHADNTYSVIDWKTGSSLGKVFGGMDELAMKYGNQTTMEVEDSVRNRAKMQIALYAVLLRSQNPKMEFRNLSLGWLPNRHDALMRDPDSGVDAWAFIPMIESMFGDPMMMEQLGLPRDLKNQLLKNDANIFNPRIYTSNVKSEVVTGVNKNGVAVVQQLDEKIARLKVLLGGVKVMDKMPQNEKDEVAELTDQINSILADKGVDVDHGGYADMSMINLYLGNYSEVNHPMVQSWKRFKDEREMASQRAAHAKLNKFQAFLKPVLEEYKKQYNVKTIAGNTPYNYDKLFGPLFVDEKLGDETEQTKERLLTSTEEDPELRIRYEALTPAQKKLLNYTNEVFSSYFNGPGAFLNETAVIINNQAKSHLEVYNIDVKGKDKRGWYPGFFFKVPPTDEDIATRAGDGNYLKGKYTWKTLTGLLHKYSTFFKEHNYEMWSNSQALPIKYLGNDYIDQSRAYTRNLEMIFHEAVSELERKKTMDAAYALGFAVRNKLAGEPPLESGQPAYRNLVKFLDHKLLHDLQRKMIISDPRKKGRSMRMRMWTPNGWEMHKVSMDSVMRGLIQWTSMNTMWVRPFQGTGNGVHAMLLTHRDGLKGAIASVKFLGISGDAIDFTSKDLVRAEGEYFRDFVTEAIKGDFRKSKMFLMAKELNYFGNNFDYASMEKTILSMRNRYMSESMMYMFHSGPEEFVSMTTMAAQLMHMKNEVTGESLWDSYKVVETEGNDPNIKHKQYELKWEGGLRGIVKKGTADTSYTEELREITSLEAAKMRKVHERLQGGYRRDEALILEAYILGKMMIHLKKYFPRLILNATHAKRLELDLGAYKKLYNSDGTPNLIDVDGTQIPMYEWVARATEGRFRTIGGMAVYFATLGKMNRDYRWDELSDEQKQNLIEFALTGAILLSTWGMYMTWFEELDDDDTMKKWWKMYLMDNLSQQYNVVDLARTMKTVASPVAVSKMSDFTVEGFRLLAASADYASGNFDDALTNDGDLKGWNRFAKSLPYFSSYKDFMNRVKNIKDPQRYGLDNIRLK